MPWNQTKRFFPSSLLVKSFGGAGSGRRWKAMSIPMPFFQLDDLWLMGLSIVNG